MVLIFDLDDTLYPELEYVRSGFLAVANELNNLFKWNVSESYNHMLKTLDEKGRGVVFNDLLYHHGKLSKKNVKHCVNIYRHHKPNIFLSTDVKSVIKYLPGNKYVVTDGHKIVQGNKVDALGITSFFKHVYITHRYGIKNSKPSVHCFDLIKKREKCEWSEMCYIGDNPSKDFVNLKPLGVNTIRIKTEIYDYVEIPNHLEASIVISNLNEIKFYLNNTKIK